MHRSIPSLCKQEIQPVPGMMGLHSCSTPTQELMSPIRTSHWACTAQHCALNTSDIFACLKLVKISGRKLQSVQKAYPWDFVKYCCAYLMPNKKLQNYERQSSPVNWKCTSYQRIFLSWDLGTVFCFLESCQAYIACKTNIQNQASSTAAKMLKSTWSLILSHPAQKSTTLTSSTSVQNGQHGLWIKKQQSNEKP